MTCGLFYLCIYFFSVAPNIKKKDSQLNLSIEQQNPWSGIPTAASHHPDWQNSNKLHSGLSVFLNVACLLNGKASSAVAQNQTKLIILDSDPVSLFTNTKFVEVCVSRIGLAAEESITSLWLWYSHSVQMVWNGDWILSVLWF